MDTLNLILLMILSAIFGFAMGNVYGQQKMRMMLSDLLNQLTDHIRIVTETDKEKKEDNGKWPV